jgi:hypothetical protein
VVLWKACNNLLSTKENLFKRKEYCRICFVLFAGWRWRPLAIFCGDAHLPKIFGRNVVKKIKKCSSEEDVFLCSLQGLMERLDDEDFEIMATIAIKNMLLGNTIVFGGELSRPLLLVRS